MFHNTPFLPYFHWKRCLLWLCLVWWIFRQNISKMKNFDLGSCFAHNSKSILPQSASFSHAGTQLHEPIYIRVHTLIHSKFSHFSITAFSSWGYEFHSHNMSKFICQYTNIQGSMNCDRVWYIDCNFQSVSWPVYFQILNPNHSICILMKSLPTTWYNLGINPLLNPGKATKN